MGDMADHAAGFPGDEGSGQPEDKIERMLAQARVATGLLDVESADPVGRGALGEAVQELGSDAPAWVVAARRRHLDPVPPELPIRTDRLTLRPFTMADLEDVLAYRGRADVVRYMLHEPFSRAETKEAMHRWLGLDEAGNALPADDPPHGQLRLAVEALVMLQLPSYSQAELGWALHPDVAGRGLATEAARILLEIAFDHFKVHRVFANVDARNMPSRALCERLGLRLETHAQQDFWSKGEWTDSTLYAMLAADYAEMRSTRTAHDSSIEA